MKFGILKEILHSASALTNMFKACWYDQCKTSDDINKNGNTYVNKIERCWLEKSENGIKLNNQRKDGK